MLVARRLLRYWPSWHMCRSVCRQRMASSSHQKFTLWERELAYACNGDAPHALRGATQTHAWQASAGTTVVPGEMCPVGGRWCRVGMGSAHRLSAGSRSAVFSRADGG